jgi:pentatricopeptide repeat protein
MERGYDKEKGSFVQSFESKALDASNLMMPLVHFISPRDKRMLSTLDRTMEHLVSDSLVYRYQLDGDHATDDGVSGEEGTFSMCTFWLVEALARAGRVDEARFIYEKMLTYSNHLGLYSEEIGPTGEALGNFPQAFTHLGLISAAVNLDRTLGTKYSSSCRAFFRRGGASGVARLPLEAFAAAADLAGLGGLFCWGWWVRSFSFWGQVVGFGAPGFAGAGVGPADDEFAGGGQLGVEAAAGFE